MAGESAQQVARKRRDKAARLNRVAAAYEKGAEGERRTADALAMLPASGWFVLHDVRWPGKRFANIDHVVVGPGGVFVIDSKAWSGAVEVRDGVLRQNGYKRDEAVASAADAAMAVAEQVPGLDTHAVSPVPCFAGDQGVEGHVGGVILCTPGTLVGMLLSRPQVLDPAAVRGTLLGLQEALKAATSAPRAAAAPRPSRRGATATPPRRSGRSRPFAGLVGFLVAAGLILVGVHELPKLATPASHLITSGLVPKTAATGHPRSLGCARVLPAGTHRPPLRVKVDHAGTAHRVGPLPYLIDGDRLFAVRLTVTNLGKRPWLSQPGTTALVTDSDNVTHSGIGSVRIREGRVLPDTLRVAPGRTVRGYVVFQLPRTTSVTGFTLTVGPGQPRTATWTINRQ